MTWGLVARADNGGLGNLSWEIASHLRPDRVLIVSIPDARSGQHPERFYDGGRTACFDAAYPRFDEGTLRSFLFGLDRVLCLETLYDARFAGWARAAGCETILYAMPELLGDGACYAADRIFLPETIGPDSGLLALKQQISGILPWPCSPDAPRFYERPLSAPPFVFLHQPGAAMLDRNGTEILRQACELIEEPCVIVTFDAAPGSTPCPPEQIGLASWVREEPLEAWPDLYRGIDAQILPRRYGWLSLPMLEAAAAGVPTITTNLWPQTQWPLGWRIPARPGRAVPMKGGAITVYDAAPSDLARPMDDLARTPQVLADYSKLARRWAQQRSWQLLGPRWREQLGI